MEARKRQVGEDDGLVVVKMTGDVEGRFRMVMGGGRGMRKTLGV